MLDSPGGRDEIWDARHRQGALLVAGSIEFYKDQSRFCPSRPAAQMASNYFVRWQRKVTQWPP
jgi:hypothetical protein